MSHLLLAAFVNRFETSVLVPLASFKLFIDNGGLQWESRCQIRKLISDPSFSSTLCRLHCEVNKPDRYFKIQEIRLWVEPAMVLRRRLGYFVGSR